MPKAPTITSSLLPAEMLAKLERMELISRKIFRGRMKGERRSKRKGQSVEFADFRNYTAGDDLRFIDWNLYARMDRLYLKLFLEEEDLHVHLVIDDSKSMDFGDPSKLLTAKRIAAALGFIGLCRGDRIKITTLSDTLGRSAALRGRANLGRMLAYLEGIEPGSPGPMTECVKRFCLQNTTKGIVVVISDLMDKNGYEAAFKMLIARELDIYLIHLLSPEELQPEVKGDLKLVDCEDGDEREISVSQQLLKRYQQTLTAFIDQAKNFCNRRSIAYVPARSDHAVEILINQYLRQRGLVR